MTDALPLPNKKPVQDLEPGTPELPTQIEGFAATDELPDFWERYDAGWRKRTIETDIGNYAAGVAREITDAIYDELPVEAQERLDEARNQPGGYLATNADRSAAWRRKLFSEVRAIKDLGPKGNPALADAPGSDEEFRQMLYERRRAEWEDANRTLNVAGPGVGGFLGEMSRDVVDPINLAFAPIGLQGGLVRFVVSEAILSGAAGAASLPREYEVADELDLPRPNATTRILTEALAGGALAAVPSALVRGAQYVKARRQIRDANKPEGMPQAVHEKAIAEAEAAIKNEMPSRRPRPRRSQDGTSERAQPPDYDFSLTGNASPRTNRVAYVHGRLLQKGMEPHIAAGFLGNFMVESTTALNPKIVGDGGNALGIAQWNDRRPALIRFAQNHPKGPDPTNLDVQIDFIFHELSTSEASAWARIRSAKTAEEAAQLVSQYYERPGVPHLSRRIGYARSIIDQYESGAVPRGGSVAPTDYVPVNTTTRAGYTQTGQVRTAAGTRVDVEYEVVDRSTLQRASGDLQPRDRTLGNSDEQVANIAATLDPVLLMPAPTADRGAPIVGPDNIVESGNGRFAAIERAYERHPDRADAYRQQIEAAGFDIPDDVRDPVLVARRTSQMDDDTRRAFVVEAQDSGVARMTAVERARAEAAMLDAGTLSRLDPSLPLTDPGNGDFIRAALDRLPRTERNAFTTPEGRLNADGRKALERALFARAYQDAELLRRFTEQDAAELRSLLDALFEAAPGWARLTGEVADGQVKPEFDITGHVTEAMRIIATARRMANADGLKTGHVLAELLDEIDLIEGAVSPLTRALVGMFWKDGKAAPKGKIAGFLNRYAAEARKVGRTDAGLFDQAPTVPDVLRTLDAEGFADLGDDLGRPRGQSRQPEPDVRDTVPEGAYADGAMSEDAIEAARTAEDDLREAVAKDRTPPKEDVRQLLAEARERRAERTATAARLAEDDKPVRMRAANGAALISPAADRPGKWRVTTFGEDGKPSGHIDAETKLSAIERALEDGYAPEAAPTQAQTARGQLLADGDFEVPLGNGETVMASEMLDDLDADDVLDTVVSACIARGADA